MSAQPDPAYPASLYRRVTGRGSSRICVPVMPRGSPVPPRTVIYGWIRAETPWRRGSLMHIQTMPAEAMEPVFALRIRERFTHRALAGLPCVRHASSGRITANPANGTGQVVLRNHDRNFEVDFGYLGLPTTRKWENEEVIAVHGDGDWPAEVRARIAELRICILDQDFTSHRRFCGIYSSDASGP